MIPNKFPAETMEGDWEISTHNKFYTFASSYGKHEVIIETPDHETQLWDLSVEDYIDLITDFVALLRPDIIIERFISQCPAHLLIAPNWNGLKNFEIVAKIDKKLLEKNLWQGKLYAN